MSESIFVDKNLPDDKIYEALLPQINSLINPDEPIISSMANITAVLKSSFNKISWVGFYLLNGNKLYLGPFQGNIACTVIEIGKGVCGSSAQRRESIIVDDVDKFPGHIACDSLSKSEIVVPIMDGDKIFGVLDLDSYNYSSFCETDKFYLEKICESIVLKLKLSLKETIII